MKATVKLMFEFDEIDVKNLMLQKGYETYTEQDLAYVLSRCNYKELIIYAYHDSDDKEIIIEK